MISPVETLTKRGGLRQVRFRRRHNWWMCFCGNSGSHMGTNGVFSVAEIRPTGSFSNHRLEDHIKNVGQKFELSSQGFLG